MWNSTSGNCVTFWCRHKSYVCGISNMHVKSLCQLKILMLASNPCIKGPKIMLATRIFWRSVTNVKTLDLFFQTDNFQILYRTNPLSAKNPYPNFNAQGYMGKKPVINRSSGKEHNWKRMGNCQKPLKRPNPLHNQAGKRLNLNAKPELN